MTKKIVDIDRTSYLVGFNDGYQLKNKKGKPSTENQINPEPTNFLIKLEKMIENERNERIRSCLIFCEEINNLSLQGCSCGYHDKNECEKANGQ